MRVTQEAADRGLTEPSGTGRQRIPPRRQLAAFAVAACFLLCACAVTTVRVGAWFSKSINGSGIAASESGAAAVSVWPENSAELTVAVSQPMAGTLKERAESFNSRKLRTADGELMRVELVTLSPREMVQESLRQPGFQALAPDSSLWLGLIDRGWAELFPTAPGGLPASRVGPSTLFAVSPIVIAAHVDAARQLGWPQQAIGWKDVQARAVSSSTEFRWGHPGTDSAAGVLATLSAFYAGAGITRGLNEDIAARTDVIDYVRKVETAAHIYGEGDRAAARQLGEEGRPLPVEGSSNRAIDAFVIQEQAVIAWNRSSERDRPQLLGVGDDERLLPEGELVAIYAKEGTIWADHPLALLELDGRAGPAVTQNQRRTYRTFTRFLLEEESQLALLKAGFRPVDLTIDLTVAPSPFANSGTVNPLLPQTLLPVPPEPVIEMVLDVWRYTKRPANIILVVDTSESMEGAKLAKTKAALHGFVAQIQGDRDRIGLMEFGSGVKQYGPLQRLDENGRSHLSQLIENMEASGYTDLIDAVWAAHSELQGVGDNEAINAIVVMSDGRDNDSDSRLRDLRQAVQEAGFPVAIHTIAFGRDADGALLKNLSRIGGGQFHHADETNLEELYRHISTYFQPTG